MGKKKPKKLSPAAEQAAVALPTHAEHPDELLGDDVEVASPDASPPPVSGDAVPWEGALQQPNGPLVDETAPLNAGIQRPVSYSSLEKLDRQGPVLSKDSGPSGLLPSVDSGEHLAGMVRQRCRGVILLRHLLAALAERMFEFAVVVLLTAVGPAHSFSLIASYGMTVNLVVALFSPGLGAVIDKANRLTAITIVTAVQNVCTAICAAIFLVLLSGKHPDGSMHVLWFILIVLIHVFGALNSLFYGLSSLALERDWVVVIADEDSKWLTDITAQLKQIDLCCDLIAPSLVSLLAGVSYKAVALIIGVANFLMVLLQYSAFHQIYAWVPRLDKASHWQPPSSLRKGGYYSSLSRESSSEDAFLRTPMDMDEEMPGINSGGEGSILRLDSREPLTSSPRVGVLTMVWGLVADLVDHSRAYGRQPSCLAGVATAMLYMTVLSFHGIMISYLLMRGLHVGLIGVAAGLSSGVGVLGALAYQKIAVWNGTVTAASLGIWWQTACLTLAVAVLLFPQLFPVPDFPPTVPDTKLVLFIVLVILSRFGLYLFDTAVVQVFQLMVDEPDRNVVGGFQRTLEALFELAGFAMVFVLPAPSQFPIQTLISYVMVLSAATLFSSWTIQLQQAARSRGESEALWNSLRLPTTQDPNGPCLQDGVLVPSKILYRRLDTIQSVTSSVDHSYHSNVVVDEPAEVEPSQR